MVENTGSDYTSNDIRSMAFQIPVSEREGDYEALGEFNLEDSEDALEYLFEEVLSENVEIDMEDALEAQYGPDKKYEDRSGLLD